MMDIRKTSSFAGALALVVGLTVAWKDAPQLPAALIIRGDAVCDSDGTYTLSWVVINPESNSEVTISSANQTGAHRGAIYLDPTRLKGGQSATGSDSEIAGNTAGAVVLMVRYVFNDTGVEAESDASVVLNGTCKK